MYDQVQLFSFSWGFCLREQWGKKKIKVVHICDVHLCLEAVSLVPPSPHLVLVLLYVNLLGIDKDHMTLYFHIVSDLF